MESSGPASSPNAPACSLDQVELGQRALDWKTLRTDALVSERTVDGGVITELQRDPAVLRRLRALIEAEQHCCAFLRFDVHEDDDVIRVAISEPGSGT